MRIKVLEPDFAVCKLAKNAAVDLSQPFTFAACTDEELSLVCPTKAVAVPTIAREDGWKGFRIEGVLDFSLVGILSSIAGLMADNGIAIFAVSTYNTDYVFIKKETFAQALVLLKQNGYEVI